MTSPSKPTLGRNPYSNPRSLDFLSLIPNLKASSGLILLKGINTG